MALEHEEAIINQCLLAYDDARWMAKELTSNCFTDYELKTIFSLFSSSASQDELFSRIAEAKPEVGHRAAAIMGSLWGNVLTLEYCVERLCKDAVMRKVRLDMAECMSLDDDELAEKVKEMADIVQNEREAAMVALKNQTEEQVVSVLQNLYHHDTSDRIFTPWTGFNKITNGLRLGNISIIGALPSSGKTSLALNIIASNLGKKRIVMFSMEMSAEQLWERIASNLADVSYSDWTAGKLAEKETEKVGAALSGVVETPTWFFDNCRNIEQQIDKVVRLKPDLVVVDFLQYVSTRQRCNTVADMLEYLVGEYKSLAKRGNRCHILILSQHSRGIDQTMFSLKGSSGIEQGGDYIALLDRPYVKDKDELPEKAILNVVKNKFGRLGNPLELYFDGDKQRFRELDFGEFFPETKKEARAWHS